MSDATPNIDMALTAKQQSALIQAIKDRISLLSGVRARTTDAKTDAEAEEQIGSLIAAAIKLDLPT